MDWSNREVRAFKLLTSFQHLEFALKAYIGCSYDIVRYKLDGEIPFKYGWKFAENFQLERLMAVFKQLNDNTELHRKISHMIETRNEIAHRAMLYTYPLFEEIYGVEPLDYHRKLSVAEKEIEICLELLAEEIAPVITKWRAMKARAEGEKK